MLIMSVMHRCVPRPDLAQFPALSEVIETCVIVAIKLPGQEVDGAPQVQTGKTPDVRGVCRHSHVPDPSRILSSMKQPSRGSVSRRPGVFRAVYERAPWGRRGKRAIGASHGPSIPPRLELASETSPRALPRTTASTIGLTGHTAHRANRAAAAKRWLSMSTLLYKATSRMPRGLQHH